MLLWYSIIKCTSSDDTCYFSELRDNLILREDMFREMKETKDNEIASIKRSKRELEQRLLSNEENGELNMG